MAHVCDFCGARMVGGGQGFADSCPNGCDTYSDRVRSEMDAREVARLEAVDRTNREAVDAWRARNATEGMYD